VKRVVLAYSGGLDTSVAIPWLYERGYEVITVTADLGANQDLAAIQAKALQVGAKRAYVVDVRDHFAQQYLIPTIHANALYEGQYPLASALSRPLISELLVSVAHQEDAQAVAHGCTGKGNDQVRFDVAIGALDPRLEVVAPVREWSMSRDEEIAYAEAHQVPIPVTRSSPYSVDVNIWGRSAEGGRIEDPSQPVPEDAFEWTKNPAQCSPDGVSLSLTFDRGIPVALNGTSKPLHELISELNQLAGAHGVGRIHMVENRLVGIKSHEVYEAPAAVTVISAHRALEQLVLTRDLAHLKARLEPEVAELTYNGLWYSPARLSLAAFMAEANQWTTGEVFLKLAQGRVEVLGVTSPASLYHHGLATYSQDDQFDHRAAKGFVDLWGLPIRTRARVAPLASQNVADFAFSVSETSHA
jgi:argininosuccinate synthase